MIHQAEIILHPNEYRSLVCNQANGDKKVVQRHEQLSDSIERRSTNQVVLNDFVERALSGCVSFAYIQCCHSCEAMYRCAVLKYSDLEI